MASGDSFFMDISLSLVPESTLAGSINNLLQELQALEGYEAYEARRRGKVDKQLTGGAATNLDEGIDRKT